MKIQLNRKKLKTLSNDKASLPVERTNQIGGGVYPNTLTGCDTDRNACYSWKWCN
ncbi:hypothetical protein ACSLBF_07115 [Pseudoalteromonas sp. T1lg65]|uniref:hypothetical protein n=1 Tax=Pseudoalteromonas sp. T1lg65 TaxID=2077101 RepID=UPI003F7AF8A9